MSGIVRLSRLVAELTGSAFSSPPLCSSPRALLFSLTAGDAKAAQACLKESDAPILSQTIFMSIAQQFAGYLPSSFFTSLVEFSSSHLSNSTENKHHLTQGEFNSEIEKFFNNQTSYGAAYVTCLAQVQACVTNAVVKSGSAAAICPGPVKGCSATVAEKSTKKVVAAVVGSSKKNSTSTSHARRQLGAGHHGGFSRSFKVKA